MSINPDDYKSLKESIDVGNAVDFGGNIKDFRFWGGITLDLRQPSRLRRFFNFWMCQGNPDKWKWYYDHTLTMTPSVWESAKIQSNHWYSVGQDSILDLGPGDKYP